MSFAEINNIKICYGIHGEGPPVILLHGFAMYKEFWIAQLDELSKFFKLITIDNRSCGQSSHPIEPFEMVDFVDDVKKLMDYLEIEKVHMIGHSLGGMIAQNFALRYPERLNKLILIATLPKFPGDISGLEMYKKGQIAGYEAKLKYPIKAFYDKMKMRFTRKFFKIMEQEPKFKFHGIFSTEDLIDLENQKGTSKPQDIVNLADAIAKHNVLEQLHEIQNKTLVLAGEKDKITPKISNEQIHEKIPNSELKVFKGGHFFPLENAPEVNKAIIDFLEPK